MFVANRHADRARALAERFGGEVGSLDELPARLERGRHRRRLDLVAAPDRRRRGARRGHARARAAARSCSSTSPCRATSSPPAATSTACALYDMDDLQAVVARNLDVREAERARAEAVVEEEIQRFARWLAQLDVMPTIAALREHGAEIVDQVLAENAGRWETASPRDLARIEAVARAVMQRLLHEPTIRLKRERATAASRLLRELFGLDEAPAERRRRGADRGAGATTSARCKRRRVRIGTRGSALALAQARAGGRAARRRARARRDRDGRRPRCSAAVRQGALGRASSTRRCCAATSTSRCTRPRTCPAQLPDGIVIAAVAAARRPARRAVRRARRWRAGRGRARRDVVAAPRRAAARAARDLEVVELRGNVDTRLRKLADGRLRRDRAGPRRAAAAGPRDEAGAPLDELVPAAGPGRARARRRGPATRRRASRAIDRRRRSARALRRRARARRALGGRLPHAGRRARAGPRGRRRSRCARSSARPTAAPGCATSSTARRARAPGRARSPRGCSAPAPREVLRGRERARLPRRRRARATRAC